MRDESWGFAPPPFKPDEALQRLRRDLRELGLSEREGRFERRSQIIAKAAVDGTTIVAGVVRRPARSSPEWLPKVIRSSADLREFVAELKQKLAAWSDVDD